MRSERDTISPNNRYRFGAEGPTNLQVWSRVYDDFEECYTDYTQTMSDLRHCGTDLLAYKWRGVFNLEQAALLVAGKNIYTGLLYVQEDAD